MSLEILTQLLFATVFLVLIFKFLAKTSLVHIFVEKCGVFQFYRVPKFNDNMQENQLYRKVYTYLNSRPGVEDSDFAKLFSESKSTEINLVLDRNQTIVDKFLGARLYWEMDNCDEQNSSKSSLVLKIRKHDRRRILVHYLQHIHQAFDEIEMNRKQLRLFVNVNGIWKSMAFAHPATMETVAMDEDLKTRIKLDLENFLKSKKYYHRLGRIWKRSYLLYGSTGTGKSSFIAAMAKFINYDIYEIDLQKLQNDADLRILILQTTKKSILVIEDLDRYLGEKSTAPVSLSGILNFMDGIFCCCDERITVFTMNSVENVGACFLRPGRIDVRVNFPLCDFAAFKYLANSHLGLKDHKLFSQVEDLFQNGAVLSPAEVCGIMISNRSPNRALKTVVTALQGNIAGQVSNTLNESKSGRIMGGYEESGKGVHNEIRPIKEIKNLYGYLKAKSSSRKASLEKIDTNSNEYGSNN